MRQFLKDMASPNIVGVRKCRRNIALKGGCQQEVDESVTQLTELPQNLEDEISCYVVVKFPDVREYPKLEKSKKK